MKMRHSLTYIVLAVILLTGCNTRPYNVLSQEDMVDVLFDVHLAESTINIADTYASRKEKQEYYNSVFEKHGLTKEEFDRSLDWYARNPKKMIIVYDELKLKVEEFNQNIENYTYHPELKPTHNDSIDTFDIWHWKRLQRLTAIEDTIHIDSVHFKIKKKEYLEHSEQIRFYLKMSVESDSIDSLEFTTRMVIYYEGKQDTLQSSTYADSIYRRYYFNKIIPTGIEIDSITVQLVDSLDGITKINVDSIELNKVYNNFEYPINYNVRNEIRDANDSINKTDAQEKEKKENKNTYWSRKNLQLLKMNSNK